MGACKFVGRVGGLAVALGVGAAAFNGSAVAWADTSATGPGTAPADSTATAAPGPRTASSRPVTARVTADRKLSGPANRRAGAHPLPAAGAVTAPVMSPAAGPSDPPADDTPAAPAESPLAWTVMAHTRRAAAAVAAPAATQPVILGPSGIPIPPAWYVDTVMEYFIPAGADAPQVVFTPEGLYPITGVKSLPLNTSVDQGLTILSDTLSLLPEGTATTMFGYSQSAIIGSLMQSGYNDTPVPPGLEDSINFVFVGNEMNPNGGLLSRFPDLDFPSLGIPFYGPTPDNAYPTTNYTLEYDGFADFPRYPLNFLADLNAALGIVYVHTKYTPEPGCTSFCTTLQQVQDAIALPSTSASQKYYFIPTENLPLLEPLRMIPIVGNPIADLIQPVLKVIVDLGYGDPAHGFASGIQPNANELVPFGLFPQVNPLEVLSRLGAGIVQGIGDFVNAFGPDGSIARELSAFRLPAPSVALTPGEGIIAGIQSAVTAFAERISSAAAALYAPLLPTADILNALLVSLPAYDVDLVLGGIAQMISGDLLGGLVNAIGLPIAANVGLVTYASLIGLLVWSQAVRTVI